MMRQQLRNEEEERRDERRKRPGSLIEWCHTDAIDAKCLALSHQSWDRKTPRHLH